MQKSEQIDKIAPAFLKAQKKIKAAHKDASNPYFNSKYADLASVFDACRDALHEHDISVLQPASSVDGVVYGVETILMHSSGQWFSEVLQLKPVKSDPQGAGSAITYARRYGVASLVGIMQQDDDGNGASDTGPKPTPHINAAASQVSATKKPVSKAANQAPVERPDIDVTPYDPTNEEHKKKLKAYAMQNAQMSMLDGDRLKASLIEVSNAVKGVPLTDLATAVNDYINLPFGK